MVMDTTLSEAAEWAQAEFAGAELGDARRTRRLVAVAEGLARNPRGTIHAALDGWAEQKGAYRLFQSESATFESVCEPHWRSTRVACNEGGDYLLVEDTTTLDYTTHKAAEGLGRIGNDRGMGLFLHSTLALRVEGWNAEGTPRVTALGLFGAQCWAREGERRSGESKKERLSRSRESERWAQALYETEGPPPGARWTHIADRESDVYEAFERCGARGADFIIRACQPRALAEEGGSVFQTVARAPVLGGFDIKIRARPGQKARTARIELRSVAVTLRGPQRPGGRPAPFQVNVVEVREVGAPEGVEPVHWVLLTTWPCDAYAATVRVVKAYSRRWLIEEYHKALKTGAGVEESQLGTAHGLRALAGVLAVLSVRLLNMKLLAEARPDEPVDPEAAGREVLEILEAKFGRPAGGWTNLRLLVAVARLGGFSARRSDGRPGWLSICRGWLQLTWMAEGFTLARGG